MPGKQGHKRKTRKKNQTNKNNRALKLTENNNTVSTHFNLSELSNLNGLKVWNSFIEILQILSSSRKIVSQIAN